MKLLVKKSAQIPQWLEKVEERKTVRVFKIKGELDRHAITQLQRFSTATRLQPGYEYKHIILDLSHVPYMDFSAVAALLKILRDYQKTHQKVALVNLQEQPQHMFWLAKISHLFPAYKTAAEAVRDFETRF